MRFGLYTAWVALDYFDFESGSGIMLFAIGSHSKYKGIYESTLENKAVPSGFSKKTPSEKANLRWGYVSNIKPGDMFIFDVKTLHGSTASTDGYLRARVDMRVSIKPSQKRYIKQMNEIKNKERSVTHLGLSQLCSQPHPSHRNKENVSPELNKPPERILSASDDGKKQKKLSQESQTVHDALDLNIDEDEEHNVQKVNIGDLPTQMNNDDDDDNMNMNVNVNLNKQQIAKKNRSITPIDISEENEPMEPIRTIPETPKSIDTYRTVHTPQSVPSVPSSLIKQKSVQQHMASYIAPTQGMQYSPIPSSNAHITQQRQHQIVPSSECQPLPRLEQQSPHNLRQNDQYRPPINVRKRTFSSMDNVPLSQEKEKEIDRRVNVQPQPPNKRQKVTSHSSSSSNKYHFISDSKMRIQNVRSYTTMSDEELGRKISTMRNKMNRTITQLTKECNEALDLMEVANERYLYMKQQQQQERDRANHFQEKVENLQKKMIENHNMLFKMFEQ